jgi:hypothetical protein
VGRLAEWLRHFTTGCGLQGVQTVLGGGDLLEKVLFLHYPCFCVAMASRAVNVKHSLQKVDSPLCMAQFGGRVRIHRIEEWIENMPQIATQAMVLPLFVS